MIDRLILSAVLSVIGYNGFFPDPPPAVTPMTPWQLQVKAKDASKSAVCEKKKGQKQSKTVKDLCKRWEKHDG